MNVFLCACLCLFHVADAKCEGESRVRVLRRAFSELGPDGSITEDQIKSYVANLPWYAKAVYNIHFSHPGGGAKYIVDRCGEDGVITLRSALSKVETCVSRCLYVLVLDSIL